MLAARGATGRPELVFRALSFGVIALAVFGWYGPRFQREVGLPAIDMDGAASPEHTLALMQSYGPHGRRDYLVFLSLDCLVPVAASLLLIALYDATTRRLSPGRRARALLVLVGALPAVCDLVENTLYALLATSYPHHAGELAQLAYVATLLKLGSAAVALSVLVVASFNWLLRQRATPA